MVITVMMTVALHPEEASPPENLAFHLLMVHYIMGRQTFIVVAIL
jgi:hypothetical protein